MIKWIRIDQGGVLQHYNRAQQPGRSAKGPSSRLLAEGVACALPSLTFDHSGSQRVSYMIFYFFASDGAGGTFA
jgi:hypothetical protein